MLFEPSFILVETVRSNVQKIANNLRASTVYVNEDLFLRELTHCELSTTSGESITVVI